MENRLFSSDQVTKFRKSADLSSVLNMSLTGNSIRLTIVDPTSPILSKKSVQSYKLFLENRPESNRGEIFARRYNAVAAFPFKPTEFTFLLKFSYSCCYPPSRMPPGPAPADIFLLSMNADQPIRIAKHAKQGRIAHTLNQRQRFHL